MPLDFDMRAMLEALTKTEGDSAVLYAGTLTATTTAQHLGATQSCYEVLVQADPDNTVDVFFGNATTQPVQLSAGDNLSLPVSNINLLYVKTASGTAVVNWLARG